MTILNADRWLYTQITTDPQLSAVLEGRVYTDLAPLGVSHPLVVMTAVSSQQVGNWSSDRIMDNELWQITIWTDQQSYSSIEPIADRIREALHKASGTGVIGCSFESSSRAVDPEGYRGITLEFRLFTQ